MAEVTNTFEHGWHSDNAPLDQPKGTYRNMSNCNLITKNGNNFSAETQQGTIVSFSIPNYVNPTGIVLYTQPQARFTPIGFFSFVDKLIVMATNDESADGTTAGTGDIIGVVTIGENGIGTWDTLYYATDLNFTKRNRLDGYALNETTSINRVYWCDDLNNPRVINYTSSTFDAVGVTNLIVGQQYIAVQGQISHNGILYGPGEVAGAIFTAVNVNWTDSGNPLISAGKVINYISTNSITIQPAAPVGEVDYKETTYDGNLYAGMKAYTYRLKSSTGKVTTWGPVSKPIHVNNIAAIVGVANYQAYDGDGQGGVLVATSSAITITISDLDFTDFQFIEVVAIEYDQTYEVIRAITKIAEVAITSSTIDIKHFGGENLGTFTVDDLTSIETVVLSAKAMTTFKMRGFMANLKERAEFTDPVTAAVSTFIYKIPSDNTGGINYQNYTYLADSVVAPVIAVDGQYRVDGIGTITYNAVVYNPGDIFIGVANTTTFVATGTAIATPIIRIQKYDATSGSGIGSASYKDIEIKSEYFDYKSQAIQHYLGGYWRGETYRIGFLGFDKYRQPFFVRWLGDIAVQGQSDTTPLANSHLINVYAGVNINSTDNDAQISINVMGLKIDGLTLTQDIVDKLDSFAIVRCPRDKKILTQGLMFTTSKVSASKFTSLATYDNSVDVNAYTNRANGKDGSWPDMYTLKSPEIQFQNADLITDLTLESGDILQPVARYTALLPYTNVAVGPVNDPNGTGIYPFYSIAPLANQPFFSKWYHPSAYTGGSAVIQRYTFVEWHQTITAFDGSSDFVNTNAIIRNYNTVAEQHPLTAVPGASVNLGATGGRCGLFWVNGSAATCLDFLNPSTGTKAWTSGANQKLLTNWVRPKSVLYGGASDAAKSLSEYLYSGHIQKVDAQFKADTFDVVSGKYIVNGIQVFGGDCLVEIYDNVSSAFDDAQATRLGFGFSYGIHFPCEMTLDSTLRQGNHLSRNGVPQAIAQGVYYAFAAATAAEDYAINSAYSTTDELDFKYPALPLGFISDGVYPARTRYSNVKTIGETIDSQRIYLPNNYRDVDTNHGEINNIKVGINRLFYWQNKGVGYLPVDEREIINGSLGSAVQLGVGGVLQRFDNMDIYFGNQHQWSLIETPDRFYWFDMRRKALCYLNFGGQVVEFSTLNGLQSFFNNRFTAIETQASPNIFDSDSPIMGRGISGWYDSRFETAYMTFKLSVIDASQKYHFGDFTVSISKQLNEFIGLHSFVPGIAHEHNNNSLSVITNVTPIINGQGYEEGDLVSLSNIQYVCILGYTAASPAISPLIDTTHWTPVSKIDEINVHWRGDTAKFYGRVYDSSIEIVVTGQGQSVSFDNYEAYGNEFNFTDVTVNSSQLTGADLAIPSYDRNYRYYDGSWKASYPLSSVGSRFFDKYIIATFNKKNNVDGDITTSLNQVKRLVFLKSVIRIKK